MLTTYPEFLAYCKTLQGETLHTEARSRPFTISVAGDVLHFVPSSGTGRRANAAKTERVLRLLAESNDWSPGAYQAMTYHASYILAVAKRWSAGTRRAV
jgi:hypothetical protein